MKESRLLLFIVIIFLNILLTFFYIKFFQIPDRIDGIGDYFCPIDWSICFIPDIKYYASNLEYLTPNFFFENLFKINGGISMHTFIYFFSTQENILTDSILVNSLLTACCMVLLKAKYNIKYIYKYYLFLLPFFLLYSIGPTKEIILLLGALLIVVAESFFSLSFLSGILLIFLSRNIFIPVFLLAKYFRPSFINMLIVVIFLGIAMPILYPYLPLDFYTYDLNKLSQNIESLKYSSLYFGFLGILISIAKNLLEPYTYFIVSDFDLTNIVHVVNLIYFTKLYIYFVRYRNKGILRLHESSIFFAFLLMLSCYPLVQARYLLIPALLVIFKVDKMKSRAIC